jgi:PleD family two-component response regulator
MTTQAGPISITVSLGVSGTQQLETPEASPEELLRRADACLYRSKHDGRNRVTVDQA